MRRRGRGAGATPPEGFIIGQPGGEGNGKIRSGAAATASAHWAGECGGELAKCSRQRAGLAAAEDRVGPVQARGDLALAVEVDVVAVEADGPGRTPLDVAVH